MICNKDEVVSWFKDLESYKRIDTMCTLLNMCLPFELRFLGTHLEELGRRDSQELRGIELRVNNPQELSTDIASCQSGEPTDIKIRRKMAMFLALIRACNRPCVNDLFKTLDGWGERDFLQLGDGDPLQELLLVYTLATNHPIFSFEQRTKCGEIFNKIIDCKLPTTYQDNLLSSSSSSLSQQQQQNIIPNQTSSPLPLHQQQPTQNIHQIQQIPVQMISHSGPITMGFTQSSISQMIPSDSLGTQIPIDTIPQQMQLPSNMSMPDFGVPPPWSHHILPSNIETISFPPPQSSSPLLSQPSSPSQSRNESPTRISYHRNNPQRSVTVRTSRRPSVETTPPPPQQQQSQQQQQQQTIIGMVGNDNILSHKNYDDLNADAFTQLQSLYRNGYTRPGHHTIPRHSKANHLHHHNPQQQQHNIHGNHLNLAYTLQNLSVKDVHHVENNTNNRQTKSGGSDSGSSIESIGEISPPETPGLTTTQTANSNLRQKHINYNRLNGRPEKLNQSGQIMYATGSGNISGLYTDVITTTTSNNNNNNISNNNNNNNNNNSLNGSNGNNLVLISTSSSVSNLLNNAVNTNPIIMQQAQQHIPQQQLVTQSQFSATYPYHAQHLATSSRPPIIAHSTSIPPPNSTYRHPTFQIQPNVELLYQYPPLTGVTFVPQTVTAVRSSPSTFLTQPTIIQTVAASPYTVNKLLSCFNCGSQMHGGRDCHEISMEDVTRGAIYKLDYSNMRSLSPIPIQHTNSIVDTNEITQTSQTHGGNISSSSSSTGGGSGAGGSNNSNIGVIGNTSSK